MGRTAVMACTHPYWSALQVGSQHIARELANRGWRVIYLAAPVTPFHLLKFTGFEVRRRFVDAIRGGAVYYGGRIEAFEPLAMVSPDGRPILRHELVSRNWWRTSVTGRNRIRKFDDATLLYIDNPVYGYLLRQHIKLNSIFRVADNHDRFSGWHGGLRAMSESIARAASLTIYSARSLESYVTSLSPKKAVLVENGVDYKAFRDPPVDGRKPQVLEGIASPIVLYVGAVDERVDLEVVCEAARRMPSTSFVFAGPVFANVRILQSVLNVHFVGPVRHSALPALMHYATAGIVPFDVSSGERRVDGIRSLKILEYLAAGLPVITARWVESERAEIPLWRYRNTDELIALIESAACQNHDPGPGREYARAASWKSAVDKMLLVLGQENRNQDL